MSFFKFISTKKHQYIGVFISKLGKKEKNIQKQIFISFVLKVISISLNLWIISVLYTYFDNTKYGIWITMISVAAMLSIMDIGLGAGLRNKLAESLTMNHIRDCKEYVSTALAITFIFSLLTGTLIYFFIDYINLEKIFSINEQSSFKGEIKITFLIIVVSILSNFIFGIVNSIFFAFQKTAYTNLLSIVTNLLFLIFCFFLKANSVNNLFYASMAYFLSVIIGGTFIFFFTFRHYNYLIPKLTLFSQKKIKPLTSLGFKFFLLQLSPIILLSTDNVIISLFIGATEVSSYSIAHKMFYTIYSIFFLMIAPLWTAITEAYIKNDYDWIKKTISNSLKILTPSVSIVVLFVIIFFDQITSLWLNDVIKIKLHTLIVMGMFSILAVWTNIFIAFLNGISRLKENIILSTIGNIINIPLAIFFIRYFDMGITGVILATVISMLPLAFYGPYLYRKIIYKESKLFNEKEF